MAFDSDVLLARLQALMAGDHPRRWLVAYSGGIDSTVLLHALVRAKSDIPVVAVHVNHGLHPDADAWSAHTASVAGQLGAEIIQLKADVVANAESGPEAAAREARYRALGGIVEAGDWLLSAHHENDQAETLFLNLLRGSGPAGLAGIGARNPFGDGVLCRPMLGVSSDDIADYAAGHSLDWIDDTSNLDIGFDRNFLRHEVMPVLQARWPAVSHRLRRSAELAAEASELQDALADIDIGDCGTEQRLSLAAIGNLAPARQRNLLRRAIRRCGLPPAPSSAVFRVVDEVIPARADAQPLVDWPGGEVRRYRDALFVLAPLGETPGCPEAKLRPGGDAVDLGEGLGGLELVSAGETGVAPEIAEVGLAVRYRTGGERIRLAAGGVTHTLKKLLQDTGVLPWMRERLPLLYAGDDLVAVADLWVSADHAAEGGLSVEWHSKPTIL